MARAVAERIRVSPTAGEGSRVAARQNAGQHRRPTGLCARAYFQERATDANFRTAIGYFGKAIDADPDLRRGLCRHGGVLSNLRLLRGSGSRDGFPPSPCSGTRALELDSTLAEAHSRRGGSSTTYRLGPRRRTARTALAVALDSTMPGDTGCAVCISTALNGPPERSAAVERAQRARSVKVNIAGGLRRIVL